MVQRRRAGVLLLSALRLSSAFEARCGKHGRRCGRAAAASSSSDNTAAFDGLSCSAFKLGALSGGEQAQRLAAFATLKERAITFISRKNAGDLEAIFCDTAPDADVYGLVGEDAFRPGLAAFFEEHRNLHHEIVGEPSVVTLEVVEYEFVKSWTDAAGAEQTWRSVDASKPRNKVERLVFDPETAQLKSVTVVNKEAQS
jgi:hypothetical protein